MRHSCNCRTTFARTSLNFIYSQFSHEVSYYVAIGSPFSLIYIANLSSLRLPETKLRRVRDKFATGSRHCEDFATIWRAILSHKILNMFKFLNMFELFANRFATLCDTSEEIANHCDCFKTALRLTRECKSQTVASQWDRGLKHRQVHNHQFPLLLSIYRLVLWSHPSKRVCRNI